MSPMELQEIQDRVRGMSKEQMQAALCMIPYELLYQELFFRKTSVIIFIAFSFLAKTHNPPVR